MARTITIDRLGRIVVPQDVRERLGLQAGTRLVLRDEAQRIVLEPEHTEPEIAEEGGILVLKAPNADIPDHRALRDERVGHLGRQR